MKKMCENNKFNHEHYCPYCKVKIEYKGIIKDGNLQGHFYICRNLIETGFPFQPYKYCGWSDYIII